MRVLTGLLGFVVVVAASSLAGCTPEPITLKKIGEACATDGDCGKMLCNPMSKVCTLKCTGQLDCPAGFDCGFASADDAKAGGFGGSCYKRTFTNPEKGGFGTACATYSPDPNSGNPCDANATNPCAMGFTCLGTVKCDANAVCSKECTTDLDCPTTMFCSVDTGAACKADADCADGFSCEKPAGNTASICVGKKWCRPRVQCSTCATHDQCPIGFLCAVDARGNRYCGRTCESDVNCPQPPPNSTDLFYACVAGNITDGKHNAATVCQPKQGACFGKGIEALGDTKGVCNWCRDGVPSDCPAGYCLNLGSDEHICTQSCQVKISGGAPVGGSDTCPEGTFCLPTKANACGTGCHTGFCAADPDRRAATCWPG